MLLANLPSAAGRAAASALVIHAIDTAAGAAIGGQYAAANASVASKAKAARGTIYVTLPAVASIIAQVCTNSSAGRLRSSTSQWDRTAATGRSLATRGGNLCGTAGTVCA